MAAMSLRQRARALWPIFSGGVSALKCAPSTTASVLKSTRRSGKPRSSTAQSSPAPTTSEWFAGSDGVRRLISSNSFKVIAKKQEADIDGIEARMRGDRSDEVARFLIEPGQHQAQHQQRQKNGRAMMNAGKDQRAAPQGQRRASGLLEARVENAAKNNLLREWRQDNREGGEIGAAHPRGGFVKFRDGFLRRRIDVRPRQNPHGKTLEGAPHRDEGQRQEEAKQNR